MTDIVILDQKDEGTEKLKREYAVSFKDFQWEFYDSKYIYIPIAVLLLTSFWFSISEFIVDPKTNLTRVIPVSIEDLAGILFLIFFIILVYVLYYIIALMTWGLIFIFLDKIILKPIFYVFSNKELKMLKQSQKYTIIFTLIWICYLCLTIVFKYFIEGLF